MNDEILKRMAKGAGHGYGMDRHREQYRLERMMRKHDRDDDSEMFNGNV
jgi:hypothetical protein